MNVADVITRVLRQFGDESSVQIVEEDIIRWINDGQKEIAVQNDLLQATGTMNTIIGTSEYTFPTDMLSMHAIYYNNQKLKYLSQQEYDAYINVSDPDEESQGTPLHYTRWASKFLLHPKPNAVGTLKLRYLQRPVDVTNNSDPLSLSQEYHMRLVEYCLKQAYETDEDWDAAAVKTTQLDAGLSILKENETTKDKEFYPTVTVLPDDQW